MLVQSGSAFVVRQHFIGGVSQQDRIAYDYVTI
jgi:hypothetical protein